MRRNGHIRYAAKRNRPRRPPAKPVPPRAGQPSSPPSPSRLRQPPPRRQGGKSRGAFEGDVAIKELRERVALAPDLPPPSPMRQERGTALGIMLRLGGLVALAAIVACAFVWISTPRPQAASDASPRFQAIAAGDQPDSPSVGEENGGLSPAVFKPPASSSDAESGASPRSEKGLPATLPQRLQSGAWPLLDRGGDDAPSLVSPPRGRRFRRRPPGRSTRRRPVRPRRRRGPIARRWRRSSPAARPILPMATSSPHVSCFAAPPKPATRRLRLRSAGPTIPLCSGALGSSASRRSRRRRAAGIGRRRTSDRGRRRNASTNSRSGRAELRAERASQPAGGTVLVARHHP
jgi:hypothetical protein